MFKKIIQSGAAVAAITAISSITPLLLINTVYAAQLTVDVKEISQMKGHILVALYSNEEAYDSNKTSWLNRVKVDAKQAQVIFTEIPDGDYAIKLFHDENDNMELDMNMLGIPSEGYGFSNNKGRFGPPSYQDAKFAIKDNTKVDINLF